MNSTQSDTPRAGRCFLCGGNAGQTPNGRHELCAARAKLGAPTPNLGERCETCNGSGTLGKGGVMLGFDLGPAAIARSIAAQFPPCKDCAGKGYTAARAALATVQS